MNDWSDFVNSSFIVLEMVLMKENSKLRGKLESFKKVHKASFNLHAFDRTTYVVQLVSG